MECFHERAFYYFRHGLFGHAHKICSEGLSEKHSSIFLYIYSSCSLGFLGRTSKALKTIMRLQSRTDLKLILCVCKFCIYSHAKNKDEEVEQTINKLKEEIINSIDPHNGLNNHISILLLWSFHFDDLAQLILQKSENNSSIQMVKAWMLIMNNHPKKALAMFNDILKQTGNPQDLLCLYGKALCLSYLRMFSDSLQILNIILSKYNFPELNIEKYRIYVLMQKWDFSIQFLEENKNIFYTTLEYNVAHAIYSLIKCKNDQIVSEYLEAVLSDCIEYEKENWRYLTRLSFALATLCNTNLSLFDSIIKLANTAYENSNEDSQCSSILGFVQYLVRNYVASLNNIQKSLERNPSNFATEIHINLLIDTGRLNEAQDSIELYSKASPNQMILNTLRAKLQRKIENANDLVLIELADSYFNFMESLLKTRSSLTSCYFRLETKHESIIDLFISFRVDAVINALDELITYNYSTIFDLSKGGEKVEKLIRIVKDLVINTQNYNPFRFFNALIHKKSGRTEEAYSIYETIFLSSQIYRLPQCLVEMSELLAEKKEDQAALSCIDEAANLDPTLLSSIDFLIIKARVTGNIKEAIPLIISLFNDKRVHFATYVKFVDLCLFINSFNNAAEYVKKAAQLILHPIQKAVLILRQAQVLASRDMLPKALAMLETLKKHKRFLIDAVKAEAELYLKFQNDNEKFIECYENFASANLNSTGYVLLGHAYNRLKMCNKAIDAYKNALSIDPSNYDALFSLIIAYVSTHRFEDSMNLFSESIISIRSAAITSLSILELMIQLKKYEEAERCVSFLMRASHKMDKITKISYFELQGDVKSHFKKYNEANELYEKSFQILDDLLSEGSNNPVTKIFKHSTSVILEKMAINCKASENSDKAIHFYKKSLEFDDGNASSVIGLFEMYKARFEIEKCQNICIDYLNNDPYNEAIALLLTSTQASNLSESIQYLRSVLDAHPYSIRSLVRLIELCARTGRIQLARLYISKAKCNDSGFSFALGLFNHYIGNTQKALKNFQAACESNRWNVAAKIAMISILSNPERKYLWFEEDPLAPKESLKQCKQILESIKSEIDEMTYTLTRASMLCCANTTKTIGEADQIYTNIINETPGHIPAAVGLARCKVKVNDFARAKSLLTFVLSRKAFHEFFSYFEEAYLMMAYIVEKESNYNSAQHLIFLALELNLCSKKAWEMSATVHHKNKAYNEAANAYSHLWNLSAKKDPEVGYQFAYCAMKAKRYEQALIICHDVLEISPEYKDLKEKILIPSYKKVKV